MRTIDEIRERVRALPSDASLRSGTSRWTLAQVLDHCASSVECSIRGFPVMRPALLRATIGRIVLRRFLGQGAMSHDHGAHIPGVPDPAPDLTLAAARSRLLDALDAFDRHAGETAPHFVYGPVTKDEYVRLHAMHVADHLRDLA